MKTQKLLLTFALALILSLSFVYSASTAYTPTTSTECNGNICNQVIYSYPAYVYEDDIWKNWDEARSIKDKGYEVNYLEIDNNYPVSVVDYNSSSLTADVGKFTILPVDIPLRVWQENETKIKLFMANCEDDFNKHGKYTGQCNAVLNGDGNKNGIWKNFYKDFYDKVSEENVHINLLDFGSKRVTIPVRLGEIIEFGANSTTIVLQTADTENLGDTFVDQNYLTTNRGTETYLEIGKDASKSQEAYLKFNISSIPKSSIINDSVLSLYLYYVTGGANTFNANVYNYHVYNQTWIETQPTWNNKGNLSYNATYEDDTYIASGTVYEWINWTSTEMLQEEVNNASNNNLSIYLNAPALINTRYAFFYSKEYDTNTTLRPKLYITYTNPAPTTTINSPVDNYNSTTTTNYFNCSATGTNLANASIWTNASGSWAINKTNTMTGNANSTLISVGLPQGTFLWTCYACDSYGCSFASANRTINIDSIVPALQITYPTATTYNANVTVWNWTVSDVHLSTCFYNVDAGANTTATCAAGYNTTNLGTGSHTIIMWANDTFGNRNSSNVTFSVDTNYPNIILNSPNDNLKSQINSINFNCTGSDNVDLSSVSLYLNGVLNQTNSTPINNYPVIFSKILADNSYTWTCGTCDNINNCVNGSNRNLLIDTINPSIAITYPTATNYSYVVTIFNTTASDTNLDKCWYSLNSGTTNITFTCNNNIIGLISNQGTNTWQVWANDTTGRINSSSVTFNVSSAPQINILSPSGFLGIESGNYNISLNYTATDPHLDKCWYVIDGGSNVSLPGCNNVTINITDLITSHTLNVYANDTFGNIGYNSSNWGILAFNSVFYHVSTYDTSTELFTLNVSLSSLSSASGILNYNGVNHTSSASISGDNVVFTNFIDVNGAGTNPFYWYYTLNAINNITGVYNQTVNPILFSLCNSTNNVSYINLTFKDEVSLADINASLVSSSWDYWLGSGTYKKTLFFSNASENPNYVFCFDPGNLILHNTRTVQYSQLGYPTRVYSDNNDLTNSTLNKTLYLLGSGSGIFVTFITTNSQGQAMPGVLVIATANIGGVQTIVGQAFTDSAGSATFWLNPYSATTMNFTKSGCIDASSLIYPTQSQYTQPLVCGGGGTGSAAYSSAVAGISYLKNPPSGITSPGVINFSYSVYSGRGNLYKIRQELIYTNNTLITYSEQACSNSSSCYTSLIYNATKGADIKGKYFVDINNGQGYILLEGDAHWRFIAINISDQGTLKDFFSNLKYMFNIWGGEEFACSAYNNQTACSADLNCKWINDSQISYCIPQDNANKAEYSKFVLLFLCMAIFIAFLNKFTGLDTSYPGMATFLVGLLIIIGSVSGGASCSNQGCQGLFYYDGLFNGSSAATGFLNNYMLAIITLLFMIGYYFSVTRRYT